MGKLSCDSPELVSRLMPVDEALQRLREQAAPLTETEVVPLAEGLKRVLAESVYSKVNVPPLANSSMDGYALKASDFVVGATLPVSQRIPAGALGENLIPNTVARIFTGAAIPTGADTVVMQEACEVIADEQGLSFIKISGEVTKGDNIRDAGEDIKQSSLVLEKGHKLRAQDLGLLASVGVDHISVIKRLKVAVFFTGDELQEPGQALAPGQIYNSNRYTLMAMLQSMGCDVVNLGIIADTLQATQDALASAASQADLVMTSGGVSVGEEDHIKAALDSMGTLDLWQISIKPGKPLAFGHVKGVPFIGLPGNPVSVFATMCILARPFVLAMQGSAFQVASGIKAVVDFDLSYVVRRQEYVRVRWERNDADEMVLRSYPNQSSGVLTSASWADGFAVVKEGVKLKRGDLVEFLPLSYFDL